MEGSRAHLCDSEALQCHGDRGCSPCPGPERLSPRRQRRTRSSRRHPPIRPRRSPWAHPRPFLQRRGHPSHVVRFRRPTRAAPDACGRLSPGKRR
eukprot:3245959-Prymnesium_polylepis.1